MTPPLLIDTKADIFLSDLRDRFPAVPFEVCRDATTLEETMVRARPEVVFGIKGNGIPPAALKDALQHDCVRWFQNGGSGVEHLGHWDNNRVTVTNCAGILAPFLAETTLAAILMLNRGYKRLFANQQAHRWQRHHFKALAGQTLVIVGLGNIGSEVAIRAKALGLRVIAHRNRVGDEDPLPAGIDELRGPARLPESLAEADFVTLHVASTESTRGLIDAAALAAMRPEAFLINMSRGPVVVEPDLIDALRAGEIAGAYLDVFNHEPLPPESPLWDLETLIIAPHMADMVIEWERHYARFFGDNLERWQRGEPLRNVVDPHRGY